MLLKRNENGNGGVGLFGLMGVCFVVLKLLGKIDWSWWYVTLPFWGGAIVLLLVFVVAVIAVATTRVKR